MRDRDVNEDSVQTPDRLYLVGVGVVVFLEAVDEARHDLLARVLTVAHHHDQPLVLATCQQTQCHRHVNTTVKTHSFTVLSTPPTNTTPCCVVKAEMFRTRAENGHYTCTN